MENKQFVPIDYEEKAKLEYEKFINENDIKAKTPSVEELFMKGEETDVIEQNNSVDG